MKILENKLGLFPETKAYLEMKDNPRLVVIPEIVEGTDYVIYDYDYKLVNTEMQLFCEYNNYWIECVKKLKKELYGKKYFQ